MAGAPLVITSTASNGSTTGTLFAGLNFFLLRRLPSRASFVEKIESNGGKVLKTEDDADYVIADHARKDAPGGSYSWTFIDAALKDGRLPDPGDHAIGAGVRIRETGSTQPTRSTRTPFTRDDDLFLWNWMQRELAEGATTSGNETFKRIEAANPRHTYQSWRDHYVKKLLKNPPAGVQISANPPPSPPTDAVEAQLEEAVDSGAQEEQAPQKRIGGMDGTEERSPSQRRKAEDFSVKDFNDLMENAVDIENIDEEQQDSAWAMWAQEREHHTAGAWYWYWTNVVRPEFLKLGSAPKQSENSSALNEPGPSRAKSKESLSSSNKQVSGTGKRKLDVSSSTESTPDKKKKRRAKSGRKEQKVATLQPQTTPYVDLEEDPNALGYDYSYGQAGHQVDANQEPLESSLTSDLNHQADQQITAEATGHLPRLPADTALASERVTMSDANHDADMQLRADDSADVLLDDTIMSGALEAAIPQLQPMLSGSQGIASEALSLIAGDEASHTAQRRFQDLIPDERTQESSFRAAQRSPSLLRQRPQSQHSHSSPPQIPNSRSHHQHPQWTAAEDDTVLEGIRLGWPSTKIAEHLPSEIKRTASAVRGRAAVLKGVQTDIDPSQNEARLSSDGNVDFAENTSHHIPHSDHVEEQAQLATREEDMDVGAGELLTEANLASQQAQHKPEAHRGVDIPEDDESRDQEDYIKYLEGILGGRPPSSAKGNELEFDDDPGEEGSDDLPAITTSGFGRLPNREDEDDTLRFHMPNFVSESVPMSSEQEIDEALEDTLKWPDSPEKRRHDVEDVVLAAQENHGVSQPHVMLQGDAELQLISEDSTSGFYPQQQQQERSAFVHSHMGFQGHAELQLLSQDSTSELQSQHQQGRGEHILRAADRSHHDMETEDDEHELPGGQSQSDGEVDLHIPSPPGGFDAFSLTSTPEPDARPENLEEEIRADMQTAGRRPTEVPEVVEISSHASSSSSYQSSDAEDPTLRHIGGGPTFGLGDFTQATARGESVDVEDWRSQTSMPSSPRRYAVETQDILNAETQKPDFGFPLPPDSEDEEETEDTQRILAGQVPAQKPPADYETEEAREEALRSFIDTMAVEGYEHSAIFRALERTSEHLGKAKLVLLEGKLGRGLPRGIPGIWSEEEDKLLYSPDASVLSKLASLHGNEECDERRRYLEDQ